MFVKAGSLWPRWFCPLKIHLLQSEDWRLSVLAHLDAFQLIYSLLSQASFSLTLLSFSHSRRCEELVHDCRKANHNPPLQEKSFLLLLMTEHSSTCTSHFITLSNTLAQWCMVLFKFIRVALGRTAFKTFKVLELKFTNIFLFFFFVILRITWDTQCILTILQYNISRYSFHSYFFPQIISLKESGPDQIGNCQSECASGCFPVNQKWVGKKKKT